MMKTYHERLKHSTLFWTLVILAVCVLLTPEYFILGSVSLTHDSIFWYGLYKYFSESISSGVFPYWDTFTLCGTPFYTLIPLMGLIEPLSFISILLQNLLGLEIFTGYEIFFFGRAIVALIGVLLFFERITSCKTSAAVAGLIFFLAMMSTYYRQSTMTSFFLTPLVLYFFLKILDNLQERNVRIYLLLFTVSCGYFLNIYIPSLFLFYLLLFVIGLYLFKVHSLLELKAFVTVKKNAAMIGASFLLLLLFMAPMISLYFVDFRGEKAEVFPTVRMLQKVNGFREFRPTRENINVFDSSLYEQYGRYNSPGNALNMIYPELFRYYYDQRGLGITTERHSTFKGLIDYYQRETKDGETVPSIFEPSEMIQYVGTITLLLALYGSLYGRTRIRHVFVFLSIMLLLESTALLNSTSKSNFIQDFFAFIFPFLKMNEVMELATTYLIFSLCALAAIGIKALRENLALLKEKGKRIVVFLISFGVLKFLFAFFLLPLILYRFHEMFSYFLVAAVIAAIILLQRNVLPERFFLPAVILLALVDIGSFYRTASSFTLNDSYVSHINRHEDKKTDYRHLHYRNVTLDNSSFPYEQLIRHQETSFPLSSMERNFIDSAFMTKRFYDYVTHTPVMNQLYFSSVFQPVITFQPSETKEFLSEDEAFERVIDPKASLQGFPIPFFEKPEEKAPPLTTMTGKVSELPYVEHLIDENVIQIAVQALRVQQLNRLENIEGNNVIARNGYSVRILKTEPNRMELIIENPQKGFLVYSDGWSKYWKAFVDGKETELYRANYAFKGIYLEAGRHDVKFVFSPDHYRYSLYAYLLAWIIGIAGLWHFFPREQLRRIPKKKGTT